MEEVVGLHGPTDGHSVAVSLRAPGSAFECCGLTGWLAGTSSTAYQRASSSAVFVEAQSQAKTFENETYAQASSKVRTGAPGRMGLSVLLTSRSAGRI